MVGVDMDIHLTHLTDRIGDDRLTTRDHQGM